MPNVVNTTVVIEMLRKRSCFEVDSIAQVLLCFVVWISHFWHTVHHVLYMYCTSCTMDVLYIMYCRCTIHYTSLQSKCLNSIDFLASQSSALTISVCKAIILRSNTDEAPTIESISRDLGAWLLAAPWYSFKPNKGSGIKGLWGTMHCKSLILLVLLRLSLSLHPLCYTAHV